MEDNLIVPTFEPNLPPNIKFGEDWKYVAEQLSIQRQRGDWYDHHFPVAYQLAVKHEKAFRAWSSPARIFGVAFVILFTAFCGATAQSIVNKIFNQPQAQVQQK